MIEVTAKSGGGRKVPGSPELQSQMTTRVYPKSTTNMFWSDADAYTARMRQGQGISRRESVRDRRTLRRIAPSCSDRGAKGLHGRDRLFDRAAQFATAIGADVTSWLHARSSALNTWHAPRESWRLENASIPTSSISAISFRQRPGRLGIEK